jgi:hypothetical protein
MEKQKRTLEYNKTRTCVQCMKLFDAAHYDTMYCSNACKQKAKRWREKGKQYARDAECALKAMRQYMKTDLGKDLYPKLKLIKGLCATLMDDYDFTRPLENGQ